MKAGERALNGLFKELLATVKDIRSFSKEQLPDVANQMLQSWVISSYFNLAWNLVGLTAGMITAGVSTYLFVRAPELAAGHDPDVIRCLSAVVGGPMALILLGANLSGAIEEIRDIYLAKKCPKSVLIKILKRTL